MCCVSRPPTNFFTQATNLPVANPVLLDPRLKPTVASAWATKMAAKLKQAAIAARAQLSANMLMLTVTGAFGSFGNGIVAERRGWAYLLSSETDSRMNQCLELLPQNQIGKSSSSTSRPSYVIDDSSNTYLLSTPVRSASCFDLMIEMYDRFQDHSDIVGAVMSVQRQTGSTFVVIGAALPVEALTATSMQSVHDSIVCATKRSQSGEDRQRKQQQRQHLSTPAMPALKRRRSAIGVSSETMYMEEADLMFVVEYNAHLTLLL